MDSLVKRINSWFKNSNGTFSKLTHVTFDNTYPDYLTDSASVTLLASGAGSGLVIQKTISSSGLIFKITGTASETITLTSILQDDASSGIESDGILCTDVATNDNHTVIAITTDGTYKTPPNIPGYFWKFTKSGVVDTPTITYIGA